MEQGKKIDLQQVRQVAKLSRLDLGDDQLAILSTQLSAILEYIEQLNSLDTENIEPLAHCLPVHNVFRADEIRPSLGTDKVLANAPDRDENFFLVPKILDDGGTL